MHPVSALQARLEEIAMAAEHLMRTNPCYTFKARPIDEGGGTCSPGEARSWEISGIPFAGAAVPIGTVGDSQTLALVFYAISAHGLLAIPGRCILSIDMIAPLPTWDGKDLSHLSDALRWAAGSNLPMKKHDPAALSGLADNLERAGTRHGRMALMGQVSQAPDPIHVISPASGNI